MNDSPDSSPLLQDLIKRVEALERGAPKDKLALGIASDDPDRMMSAFMLALGASTFDTEVDMFFMFKATTVLCDPKKRGDIKPPQVEYDMKKHGAMSIEELIGMAGEVGVRITVCTLAMDLMGIKREDLIDYPHLNFAGVASFVDMCGDSKQCWFM